MVNKNNNLATAKRRRGGIWFALLSVAWLQVSLAAHQFDHSADFLLEDSCHACSHLDRVDDLVADPSASDFAIPQADDLSLAERPEVVRYALVRRYDSRGPPQL